MHGDIRLKHKRRGLGWTSAIATQSPATHPPQPAGPTPSQFQRTWLRRSRNSRATSWIERLTPRRTGRVSSHWGVLKPTPGTKATNERQGHKGLTGQENERNTDVYHHDKRRRTYCRLLSTPAMGPKSISFLAILSVRAAHRVALLGRKSPPRRSAAELLGQELLNELADTFDRATSIAILPTVIHVRASAHNSGHSQLKVTKR